MGQTRRFRADGRKFAVLGSPHSGKWRVVDTLVPRKRRPCGRPKENGAGEDVLTGPVSAADCRRVTGVRTTARKSPSSFRTRQSLPANTPMEIWFQDEARVGQKTNITRRWRGGERGPGRRKIAAPSQLTYSVPSVRRAGSAPVSFYPVATPRPCNGISTKSHAR